MKLSRTVVAAALFGVAALVGSVAPASAQRDRDGQQRWIDVVNRTNVTIREFYMTDVDTNGWGDDRLGQSVVAPGQQMRVMPTARQRARAYCMYDMRIVFENNRSVERRQVNLCTASEIVCSGSACTVR
jgi:hypothetical protein